MGFLSPGNIVVLKLWNSIVSEIGLNTEFKQRHKKGKKACDRREERTAAVHVMYNNYTIAQGHFNGRYLKGNDTIKG